MLDADDVDGAVQSGIDEEAPDESGVELPGAAEGPVVDEGGVAPAVVEGVVEDVDGCCVVLGADDSGDGVVVDGGVVLDEGGAVLAGSSVRLVRRRQKAVDLAGAELSGLMSSQNGALSLIDNDQRLHTRQWYPTHSHGIDPTPAADAALLTHRAAHSD